MIRPAQARDAEDLTKLYNHYILNTTVTFEEEPITAQTMAERIADVEKMNLPWLGAQDNDQLVGYAYATKWKARQILRLTTEALPRRRRNRRHHRSH